MPGWFSWFMAQLLISPQAMISQALDWALQSALPRLSLCLPGSCAHTYSLSHPFSKNNLKKIMKFIKKEICFKVKAMKIFFLPSFYLCLSSFFLPLLSFLPSFLPSIKDPKTQFLHINMGLKYHEKNSDSVHV